MKKLSTILLSVVMAVCALALTACGASDGHIHYFNTDKGYVVEDGVIVRAWECDCGEIKTFEIGEGYVATPENVQDILDGKHGALSGKIIALTAGEYGALEFGRPTSYEGGETTYVGVQNGIITDLDAIASMTWGSKYYTRTIKDLTIICAEGAVVESLTATSGHVYGTGYDYVVNKEFNGSGYYVSHQFEDITFNGVAFTGKVDFNTSLSEMKVGEEVVLETTSIDGLNFINCSFTTGGTESSNGVGLRVYSEMTDNNEVIKNVVVEKCTFTNVYQGIYTGHVNGVTVKNNAFDTTGHNAIAIQNGGVFNHGVIVIDNNTFNNVGDRIIRFNTLDAESITITNNVATNSGDDDLQVIKATSIEDGIEFIVNSNDWGEGRVVANEQFEDAE